MKKLKCLLALLLGAAIFGFISCGNDDDDTGGGTNSHSVTIYASTDGSSKVIKAEDGTVFSELLSKNSINPSASISSRAVDGNSQYEFEEWSLEDWSSFAETSKITKNITIYAIFLDKSESSDESVDDITVVSVKKYLRGDISTKKQETTTVTNAGGTKTTTEIIEITNADGSSSTSTTKKSVSKEGTETVTSKEVVTTDKNGNTKTETTDSSGKTTTKSLESYKDYISQGVKNLQEEKIDQAVISFNKAYSVEANDETRVYSALATLASTLTNSKMAAFVKNRFGITNYPTNLNGILSGNWLKSATYVEDEDENEYYDGTSWISKPYTDYTKFVKLGLPSWFKDSELNNWLFPLLLANVLEGNTNGLNDALDDLYGVLFGSEYKTACERIDAISGSVTLSEDVVSALEINEIWGEGDVSIGKAELKLIESALNLVKGTLEYFQSLQLDEPLSFLKFDWADEAKAKSVLESKLGKYDASIDPLANGFLGTRDETKLNASKATFVSICDDLIAAYDSILSESSKYPTAAKDALEEYKVLKSAAQKLKAAIANGGKFKIPSFSGEYDGYWDEEKNEWVENYTPSEFENLKESGEWPDYTDGDFGIDFGALFTKDVWKLGFLSDTDKRMMFQTNDNKLKIAFGRYSNYHYDSMKVSITFGFDYWDKETSEIKSLKFYKDDGTIASSSLNTTRIADLKELISVYDRIDIDSYCCYVLVRTDRISPLLGFDWESFLQENSLASDLRTIGHKNSETNEYDYYYYVIPLPLKAGLWLYNFYYDGAILNELKALD